MRQMGGAYLYSFEVSCLLLGLGLNLSGLPYSAGFFSKEFLLFQLFKDDFISILVRSCWFISFFCTPIYMFTLVVIVNFGIKKGVVGTYKLNWNNKSLFNKKNYNLIDSIKAINSDLQIYYILSKTSALIFFIFWLFFYNWGEKFLLIIFNFSSITDPIRSSAFTLTNSYSMFLLFSASFKLSNSLFFYVIVSLFLAVAFLTNTNIISSYKLFFKKILIVIYLSTLLFLIF